MAIYQDSVSGNLVQIENSSDSVLDILSQNNPEVSELGSQDSVATSFSIRGTAKTMLDSTKLFMGWIFTGTAGQMLIAVFVGMFGILSYYFIYKAIRTGM